MDTSKTYIQMCDESKEIQMQSPDDLSLLIYKNIVYTDMGGTWWAKRLVEPNWWHDRNPDIDTYNPSYIWLPRQDQLQEMVREHWKISDSFSLVHYFTRWLDSEKVGYYESLSMEQLWLAFVMGLKYQKQWNGQDWISNDAQK